jgi:hypothetical protein
VLVGCSPEPVAPADTGPSCALPFIGDPNQPIALEVTVLDGGKARVLTEGADVPLIFPPQGGRVVFLGARVTNIDPCAVRLSGAIRDPATSQVRIDNRTINLRPTDDGFGASIDTDISTFSNVPMCPNQWASTDAFDQPFKVELEVRDRKDRSAKKVITVTPRCAEPDRAAECLCMCKKGYVLGETCAADGGTDAAADVGADVATDASTDVKDAE